MSNLMPWLCAPCDLSSDGFESPEAKPSAVTRGLHLKAQRIALILSLQVRL
jgi:hypothetical protein